MFLEVDLIFLLGRHCMILIQEAECPYYLKFVVLKRNDQILVSIEYNSEIIDDSEVKKKISLSIQRQLEDLKHISII